MQLLVIPLVWIFILLLVHIENKAYDKKYPPVSGYGQNLSGGEDDIYLRHEQYNRYEHREY